MEIDMPGRHAKTHKRVRKNVTCQGLGGRFAVVGV